MKTGGWVTGLKLHVRYATGNLCAPDRLEG
jgi:hypothetical protein